MKKVFIFIIIAIVLLISIFLFASKEGKFSDKRILPRAENDTIRFEGSITDSTNGCWIESGVCYIEIDNKWRIVVALGLNASIGVTSPMGEVVGIETTKDDIGKKVEVYAEKVSETELSIFGSEEYYVKVIDDVDHVGTIIEIETTKQDPKSIVDSLVTKTQWDRSLKGTSYLWLQKVKGLHTQGKNMEKFKTKPDWNVLDHEKDLYLSLI